MKSNNCPYEYYGPILCVKAKWLYNEAKIITRSNYDYHVRQGNFNKLRTAGGRGNYALIEWESLYPPIKEMVLQIAPVPEDLSYNVIEGLIENDNAAYDFFINDYKRSDGTHLSSEKQKQYINSAIILNACQKFERKHFKKTKVWIWQTLSTHLSQLNHPNTLPTNWRSLKRAFKGYLESGYEGLLHKNDGNVNAVKIKETWADFLLAQYCLPIKLKIPDVMFRYENVRLKNKWPTLTEQAVHHWLNLPEQKRIWTIVRQGKEIWTNKYGYHVKRDRSKWFPNSYWAIDGTKFDALHYQKKNGMGAKMKINVCFDVFSEKVLGYSFSETENHVDHFTTVKMAMKTSGCRPLLFTYDNQSGHKSQRMQELYSAMMARNSGTHYPHQAYRHSNPTEQLFGRLQQQQISKLWYSDKQSITAKSDDSRPNMDFIKENKHRLPTKEEMEKAWVMIVKQWNESKHPKYKNLTRDEVYNMEMPEGKREEVDILDMVHLFWVKETKAIKYNRGGLHMRIADNHYDFEVRDSNGDLDLEFRKKYIGTKFIVRYDPEFMDQYIQLYVQTDEGLAFVTDAIPKETHESIPALMEEGDKGRFNKDFGITELEYQRDYDDAQEVMKRAGISPDIEIDEQELIIKSKGKTPKDMRSDAESNSVYLRL